MTSALNSLAQLSTKATVWNVRPFQIVSLLEMLEHRANLFYTATHMLCKLHQDIITAIKDPGRGSDALPTLLEASRVASLEKRLRAVCDDQFEYARVLERLSYLNGQEPRLQPLVGGPFTLSALKHQLDELMNEIARTLGDAKFMMIPSYDAAYYDNPVLFGPAVADRFPNANQEITEAGSCYATGHYTACVFHLMRAVEHGARAMVKALRVSSALNTKVELSTWNELITALEGGLKSAAAGRRKSLAKSQSSEFYNHAIGQFRNFKDAWRNNVSHTRKTYQQGETKDILDNTRQFMQHLATKLKE